MCTINCPTSRVRNVLPVPCLPRERFGAAFLEHIDVYVKKKPNSTFSKWTQSAWLDKFKSRAKFRQEMSKRNVQCIQCIICYIKEKFAMFGE